MSDFAHHDDDLAAAHRSDHTVAPTHQTPALPNVTSEELRASRGELLAALDAARTAAAEAWAVADHVFAALKGRHLTTTTKQGDTP